MVTKVRVALVPLHVPFSVALSQPLKRAVQNTAGVGLSVRVEVLVTVAVEVQVGVKVAVGSVPVGVAVAVGVEVAVDVTGAETKLPEEMEQHLLRIAQEAVANALKHAGASRIEVKLEVEARTLHLRIKDDGRGFDQQDVFSSHAGHFGVIGMRERAERLGGELRLASNPGEGTEVVVTVPLP